MSKNQDDPKRFATLSWDFQDLPTFSKEQAEEFLAEHEQVIRNHLIVVGHDFISDLLAKWVPRKGPQCKKPLS